MKYPYWVRKDGVDYAPGIEVPEDATNNAPVDGNKPSTDGSSDNSSTGDQTTPPSGDDNKGDGKKVDETTMTREEYEKILSRTKKDDLIAICKEKGIEITEDATNKVLAAAIIEKVYG